VLLKRVVFTSAAMDASSEVFVPFFTCVSSFEKTECHVHHMALCDDEI
jgi:hypothetical protein